MVSGGADIQPNNNWAKVHNGILEVLASTNFTARELRCLLYLLRMTYGERCKEHAISLNEWTAGTNMRRPHVFATLQSLVNRNVIIKTETGTRSAPIWAFNKYFEQWQPSTPVGTFNGIPKGTSDSTPVGTTPSTPVGAVGSTPVLTISQPNTERENNSNNKSEAAAVFACWKDNMPGTMSTILADDLGDLVDTYGGDTVIRAITEAVRSNGRSIRYVAKILENWATGKGKRSNELDTVTTPTANGKVSGFDVSQLLGGA